MIFFHWAENGWRCTNRISRLKIGDQEYAGSQAVGGTLVSHFQAYMRRGTLNQWKWSSRGAKVMNQAQQAELVKPFLEEKVCVAIKGINAKGAPGSDGLLVFFCSEFLELVRHEVMAMLEEFRQGMGSMEYGKLIDHFCSTCRSVNKPLELKIFVPSHYLAPFTLYL